MLAEAALLIEEVGVLSLFATVDNAEVPVLKIEETAVGYVVVELETCALWPDTPELMAVALGATVDVGEALDMGLVVGRADLEETRFATSASSK